MMLLNLKAKVPVLNITLGTLLLILIVMYMLDFPKGTKARFNKMLASFKAGVSGVKE